MLLTWRTVHVPPLAAVSFRSEFQVNLKSRFGPWFKFSTWMFLRWRSIPFSAFFRA